MTQSFDDWVKKDYPHLIGNHGQTLSMCMGFAKQGYEAGAQSKQAEIDELRKRIDCVLSYLVVKHKDDGWLDGIELKIAIDILEGTTNEQ